MANSGTEGMCRTCFPASQDPCRNIILCLMMSLVFLAVIGTFEMLRGNISTGLPLLVLSVQLMISMFLMGCCIKHCSTTESPSDEESLPDFPPSYRGTWRRSFLRR
ncbi:unnamed protein product, partial [Meganyctiphanes norvegica]